MKKAKEKTSHSIISNIIYILRLMFSISPMLVIGEIVQQILSRLPAKLISVVGIKYVIDGVQGGTEPRRIILAVLAMALVLVASEVFNVLFFELYAHRERERLYLGIHSKLYDKAVQLDLSRYDSPSFYGDFILAIETSSENINQILGLVKRYIGELVAFLTIGTVIITIDPVCLLIITVFVLAFIPLGKYIGNVQMSRREKMTELHRRGDYFARLFYLPDYAGEIRVNSVSPLLIDRFDDSADEIISWQRRFLRKLDSLFFVQEAGTQVIGFMLALTAYIGYRALVTGSMGGGDFVATFNAAVQIGNTILFLTVYGLRSFTERSKMIEKYRTFLASETRVNDGEHEAVCGEPEEICIRDVDFSYEGSDEQALHGISLDIRPREKIALVGYNGAGKTTLTNLLLRLYDVQGGSIKIGGRDIREETVASHRARFSAVFQDFQIFGATLAENVALDVDYDEERVRLALAQAGFDKELTNGIDTVLLREFDDEGTMLSGGEQQKVAIARAFYKQCPYVILDEPSANLDPVSEYNLNRAIMEHAADKTVVFISHRLSTTRHADRIVMMEQGRIIESGSHEELMAADGKYAYMFRLQAEKYDDSCQEQ